MFPGIVALALLFAESSPSFVKINIDINHGVDVVLVVVAADHEFVIPAGKTVAFHGYGNSKLVVEARFVNWDKREVYRFTIELVPGRLIEGTLRIRANPARVVMV